MKISLLNLVAIAFLYNFIAIRPAVSQNLTSRIENEVMFSVEDSQTEEIWQFLKQNFNGEAVLAGSKLRTVESIEWFKDEYYDTYDRKLLSKWAGLRHRERIGEGGKTKGLVQLKLTPHLDADKEDQNRTEVKFKLRKADDSEKYETDDKNELLHLVASNDKPRLKSYLSELGVDANKLQYFMTITQERRRIYFRDGDKQLFTVTEDISRGGKYWSHSTFTQLELEISEIALTTATEAQKTKLFEIQKELREILTNRFPSMKQDQAPKMVKMYDQIFTQGIISRLAFKFEAWVFASIALIVLILFLAYCVGIQRRRENIRFT